MKAMIDLNVLLDVVQHREPFYSTSAAVLSRAITRPNEAVVASSAEAAGCEVIITRNLADFSSSPIPALTPEEFLLDL